MSNPEKRWGRIEIICLIAVFTLSLGHLVMGLGGHGLWDPPTDWKATTTRRALPQEKAKGRKDPGTKETLITQKVTEIALAERARRKLSGEKDDSATEKEIEPNQESRKSRKSKHSDGIGNLPERPPMQGWLIRTGLKLFGVHDWAARLPFALAGLLTVLMVYLFGTWMFGWLAGLVSALVLLGFPGFVFDARMLTSNMDGTIAVTLATAGLAVALMNNTGAIIKVLGALGALSGMVLGYLSTGAVLGVMLPCLIALGAMSAIFFTTRTQMSDDTRRLYFYSLLGLGVISAFLIVWTQIEIYSPKGYSAFLGAVPHHASSVASYEGITTPPSREAVFDALVRHLAYSTFPWIALFPVALVLGVGFLKKRTDTKTSLKEPPGEKEKKKKKEEEREKEKKKENSSAQVEEIEGAEINKNLAHGKADPKARDESAEGAEWKRLYGGAWISAWAAFSVLLCTYWILRFSEVKFLGSPALALACGVTVSRMSRTGSSRRPAALALALFIIAIIIRDFMHFPQALVQSGINYNIIHPESVSLKRPVIGFGVVFAGTLFFLMLLRPGKELLKWPRSLSEWLCATETWKQLEKLKGWGWLKGPRLILGGPGAFITILGLLLMSLVSLLIFWVLELFFYPLWLIDRVEKNESFRPSKALFPGEDLHHLRQLFSKMPMKELKNSPDSRAIFRALYWGPIVLLVTPLWCLKLIARFVAFLAVGLPFYAGAKLLRFLAPKLSRFFISAKAAKQKSSSHRTAPENQAQAKGIRYWVVFLPCLAGLSFTFWSGHNLLRKLSSHFSHRALFDSFKDARGKDKDSPLAVYKMDSRSADFYNAGNMITQEELRRRYPYGRSRLDPLVAYMAEPQRVFAITSVSNLGSLDTGARRAGVKYHVLDADSQWFLLVSNQLGPNEKDENPLLEIISEKPPREIGRPIGAILKEPTSKDDTGDLKLLGVEMPEEVYKGHEFPVTLHFAVRSDLKGQWKIFIHFDGPGPRFFGDHDPLGGKYNTRHWSKGTYITDPYVVPAHHTSRVSTPSGVYRVWMGFYRGDTRMTVLEGPKDNTNRINLGTVRVRSKPLMSCK